MNRLNHTKNLAARRKYRVRSTVSGTAERPRLALRISQSNISVQIIDDSTQRTLLSATTVGQKVDGSMTERAQIVGAEIAKKAKAQKVNKVVLDRGSKLYHGRVKAFAESARENGLEF
jgi:large subunit ribosomal protein L18